MSASEQSAAPFSLVIAVFRSTILERVEEALKATGTEGITVSCAKGYGEYANFFSWDPHVPVVRIEVFANRSDAQRVAQSIAGAAHTGEAGDGVIAIVPVEQLIRIREAGQGSCA